jgi:hypothetical protein
MRRKSKNCVTSVCTQDSNKIVHSQSDFREAILTLLKKRGPLKSICPSELLPPELKKDKIMMEQVRRSAILLALDNKIEITQSGKVVDPQSFRGAIRLTLK